MWSDEERSIKGSEQCTYHYPQQFLKKKLDAQFSKLLETFKNVHINIQFANAFEQMSNYANFMKECMSKKKKLENNET